MPTQKVPSPSIFPVERIARAIFLIRDEKVMLDQDIAAIYGVPTKVLNQAVTRNRERFKTLYFNSPRKSLTT